MVQSGEQQLAAGWQQASGRLRERLTDAFVRHAIDNRGALTSTRRTDEVVDRISQLALNFVTGAAGETEVIVAATELADQGLVMTCGAALMRALGTGEWMETAGPPLQQALASKLLDFQFLFLEKLSSALILIHQRSQERSQKALQVALETQIEQQRQLHFEQETYNETAIQILALNTYLAGITDEDTLLDEGVSGICHALDLADATFYDLSRPENHWTIRTTTVDHIGAYEIVHRDTLRLLDAALESSEIFQRTNAQDGQQQLLAILLFQSGQNTLGAMLVNSRPLPDYQVVNLPVWLRTFAHNLAAHWHNLQLFAETRQRSLEMEILYGRYIDSIWNPETASLYASYQQNNFQLNRDPDKRVGSRQAIPLLISDYPLGKVNLPDNVQLTQDQTEFVYTLIREMGNALNNAYLLQTTSATSNQLSLATEVSRAATTILDRDQLIREVVELIRGRFNFYYVGLFVLDEKGETAVLQSGTGEAGRLQVERKHFQRIGGPSMIGTCIADGQAIVEQDITQAKAFKFNPLLPDTSSELALPLRTRGQIIGALTVQSSQKGAFSSEAVAVLQSLADQLAIAIENAGLFAQTQATLAETSLLYQASRKISEAQTANEVYEALVGFARDSGQTDAAYVVIVNPEDPAYLISPVVWSRHNLKINRLARQPFEFNKQLEKNEIVVITNPHTDQRLDETTRELFFQNRIQSAALIPIYVEKSWLGTFLLHRTYNEPFKLPMLTAYRTLADQAAVILSNQQLFAEIKAANEKLRQLDQLKTQFLANMSHELRTPLNSIIGFSRVILKGIDGPITPEQEEDLTSIHSNGQHLLSLINEVLDMAKIEAGKMALTFETVNLETVAQAVFASTRALIREDVELIWGVQSNLPPIEADPVRLRQILMNLLSNAAKFTHEGTIRLDIFQDAGDHVHIAVHDTGIGIAPKEFEALFKAFEQVDNSTTRKAGGTGLGLPITKWLVNMHEGHIWVESLVNDGTTVHVRLPLKQTSRNLPESTFMESLSVS